MARLYKPREIARLGLISVSPKENTNYFFVINLIKSGELKAINYGVGSRKYWLVSDTEINRYLRRFNKRKKRVKNEQPTS